VAAFLAVLPAEQKGARMNDAIVNRLELLTEAVGRLVSEAMIKNAHDNELRALLERGAVALERVTAVTIYPAELPHDLQACSGYTPDED
jgi:hypothetical protein